MLICLILIAALPSENLPSIGVVPLSEGTYDLPALAARAGERYEASERFNYTDLTRDPGFTGDAGSLVYRLREMAASLGVDAFMVLDVGKPVYDSPAPHHPLDTLPSRTRTSVEVAARFYTSDAVLLGTLRETMITEAESPCHQTLAMRGVDLLVTRSLLEVFPIELTFRVEGGPVYRLPAGHDDGIRKGMVFTLVARSAGIPQSRAEYEGLRSRGIIQITGVSAGTSTGRLITGKLTGGSLVTAVETSSPANIFLQYAAVPVDIVPGSGLTGDEARSDRVMNQLELGGWTSRWGLAFGGALVSGVLPRMSTIGVRGSAGARIPISSPSLALRLEAGVETDFLIQDTRADTVSASANTVIFSATAGAGFEWLFSSRLGIQGTAAASFASRADNWTVQDRRGFSRNALPGEIYYAEVKPAVISGRLGLFYMAF